MHYLCAVFYRYSNSSIQLSKNLVLAWFVLCLLYQFVCQLSINPRLMMACWLLKSSARYWYYRCVLGSLCKSWLLAARICGASARPGWRDVACYVPTIRRTGRRVQSMTWLTPCGMECYSAICWTCCTPAASTWRTSISGLRWRR